MMHNIYITVFYSITSGSTWHAAGLFTQLKATESETRLATYAHQLIPKLEEETGVSTGVKITIVLCICVNNKQQCR